MSTAHCAQHDFDPLLVGLLRRLPSARPASPRCRPRGSCATTRTSSHRFSFERGRRFDDLDRVAHVRLVVLVVDVADRRATQDLAVLGDAAPARGISTRRVFAILSLVTTPITTRLGMTTSAELTGSSLLGAYLAVTACGHRAAV